MNSPPIILEVCRPELAGEWIVEAQYAVSQQIELAQVAYTLSKLPVLTKLFRNNNAPYLHKVFFSLIFVKPPTV